MIETFLIALVIFTILSLLLDIFVFGKYRKLLYIIIPLQLALATFGYVALGSIKGFPTDETEELYEPYKFTYMYHVVSGSTLYILTLPEGAEEPRLYKLEIPESGEGRAKYQQLIDSLNKAKVKGEETGLPLVGSLGSQEEGEFKFKYILMDHHVTSPKEQ